MTEAEYAVEATGYAGTYDGQPHGITVAAPADAAVTYSTDNAYTDATSGAVEVGYTVERANYKTITGSQTVKIDPAPLSVTTVGKTKVYDGEPLTEAGNSVAGLVAGETLGVTNTGSITDVGSADNGYELEWAGGENGYTAKRSNYALGEPTLGRLVVTPAAATVYVNSSSKRFNDSDPEFAGSVSGLVGTDSLGDITYSRTNDAEEVGVYEGVLTATVEHVNGNYTYEVVNGDFTIERAEGNIVRIDADGLTKTYDGLGASINAHAEIDGSTLLYSADGETWSPDNPSYTDAGTYTVYAMATNDSYEDTGVVSATIVVNPAQIIVTADDQSKITGTDDPALTYASVGGENGEIPGFTGELERIQGEAVGSYAINQGSLSIADNDAFKAANYTLRYVAGALSITATTPVPLPTPAPTPPIDTPAPVPTPGVLPANDPIAPVVDVLQNIVETVIPNDETPLAGPAESTIEDDETPLATFDYVHCWVHYYLILGIILTLLYGVGVLVRRIRFTGKLKAFEDDVLGIEGESASAPVAAPVEGGLA